MQILRAILPFIATLSLSAVEPREFLDRHCYDCHDGETSKGDLDLPRIKHQLTEPNIRAQWIHIHDRVKKGEMPPNAKKLPAAERHQFVDELASALHKADLADVLANGRGPIRRLTREEYENNLRDLLALPHLDVRDKLPADRDSHGFTRVSKLLDMSRVQLAGYLDATEEALQQAVASGLKPPPLGKKHFTGTDLFPATTSFGGREAMFFIRNNVMLNIPSNQLKKMSREEQLSEDIEVAIFRSATWPYFGYPRGFRASHDGRYRVRFAGRAVRQLQDYRIVPAYDPLPMSFRARQSSGPDVSGDVRETGGWMDLQPEQQEFETTIQLKKGEVFEYSLLGLPVPFIRTDNGFYYDYPPRPRDGHRGAVISWMDVEGPLTEGEWPPASHRVLFGDLPIKTAAKGSNFGVDVLSKHPAKDAERLFRRFTRQVTGSGGSEETVQRYLTLIIEKLENGGSFVEAMIKGYQAFLCSGHVVYLPPRSIASRLSHLLWSSRPDEHLRKAGALDLRSETDRLIADDRFENFVNDFTAQWLELGDVRRDEPDNRLYPEYRKDDYLIASLEKETRAFFRAMVRENLPITTLVDSEFTYVNDRLARHYGLQRVPGSKLRRFKLPNWSPYGGLLTQASILKLTSNGTTTSPVIRGAWVMDKIMGDRPPPPPKSVPAVEPDIRGATTIRNQLAKHTKDKSCAACHARFDPVGFALENFDVMGAWRDRYRTMSKGEKITGYDPAGHPYTYFIGQSVEAHGKLLDGRAFRNIGELKQLLAAKPRQLASNLLHHLTLYATGTPVRFSDRSEIDSILEATKKDGYRVRDLLHGLIGSRIFTGNH